MAISNLSFEARLGGDGECFCFYVNTDTFIFLKGRDYYLREVAMLREMHDETDPDTTFTEPLEWPIYPNTIFPYENSKKYIVSFGLMEIK